mmetsp:Transcript_2905/g.4203  ORF Transcript_2905/g.4203 Transcript_2905/m.4203 type:complete len:220 (+) Transcript_2905:30-689(+)
MKNGNTTTDSNDKLSKLEQKIEYIKSYHSELIKTLTERVSKLEDASSHTTVNTKPNSPINRNDTTSLISLDEIGNEESPGILSIASVDPPAGNLNEYQIQNIVDENKQYRHQLKELKRKYNHLKIACNNKNKEIYRQKELIKKFNTTIDETEKLRHMSQTHTSSTVKKLESDLAQANRDKMRYKATVTRLTEEMQDVKDYIATLQSENLHLRNLLNKSK